MARFTASVDLNARIQITGAGAFDIYGEKRGEFLPAGEEFWVPDDLAEIFLREYGPRPATLGVSGTAQGRVPGLTRVR